MGTPRMRTGTSFWCGIDASAILSWVTREPEFLVASAHTQAHTNIQKTGIVGYHEKASEFTSNERHFPDWNNPFKMWTNDT